MRRATLLLIGLCLAAAPALALTLMKPGRMELIQFQPGESQLPDATRVAMARRLPSLYMLNVEILIVSSFYGTDAKHGLPTKRQAMARVAVVADFYEQAGVPRSHVFRDIRPANGLPKQPQAIMVFWNGWCKPERHYECQAEYFNLPPSAASQPAQSPPATSP